MTAPETTFSELIQHPRDTVARLHASRTRSLRLRRRGEEDLLLITATRADQTIELTSLATGLLTAFADDEAGRRLLLVALPKVFPWVTYLPAEDLPEFVSDVVETLRAAESLDNPAPLVQVITEWRHTAEVHADPELRELVGRVTGDFGDVPPPHAA